MKQIENNFAVSGSVGKDAEIRQFANASVARFSLAVRPSGEERRGNETCVRFHQRGSLAQQRQHRFACPNHQGYPAHSGGLFQTRRMD